MDSLDELMNNFDVKEFLTELPSSATNSSQSPGLKADGDDPISNYSIDEECSFTETEPMSSLHLPQHVPTTTEVHGLYNFQVELGPQLRRVANPEWVFKNNKLYIKSGTLCPIMFSSSDNIPESCNIRIMAVFKNVEDARDIVRCCPNHVMENADKLSFSTVKHFVRCESDQVLYKECPLTGRYYLVLPYTPNKIDTHTKRLSTHELLSFVCNNSCVGLNRRSIQIIFEISHRQMVLGRRLLEVRVCACPGRDSTIEERQQRQPFKRRRRLEDEIFTRSFMNSEEPSQGSPLNITHENKGPSYKRKTSTETFYLKVNGRQNFVIMERISKALELFTSMEKRFFSKSRPFHVSEQKQNQARQGYHKNIEDSSSNRSVYYRNHIDSQQFLPNELEDNVNWFNVSKNKEANDVRKTMTRSQNMQISYSKETVRHTNH
ncbi:cellular tumor antigen p53-like [Xenia sp. Carnegie-2017]|uniref:cellular tumor antigen p53-like n=1 Tax=Xenia sp. Carnegie-2017 TaxID=2897299 RepID=UPI001F0345A8|nr:cellular tumor antigen p53-like [Xenia sp. Carnegie-2017]